MSSPPSLNYAPPPPMYQRKGFRNFIAMVLMLCIGASSYWWAPIAVKHVELLYWEHRCLTYTPAAGQIIFDKDSHTGQIPAAWTTFYSILSPPGGRSDGTIFLHEMRKQNGERRLVAVDVLSLNLSADASHSNSVVGVFAHVFHLGTLSHQPLEHCYSLNLVRTIPPCSQIFSGQPDPIHADHFTFYTNDPVGQTQYDGWLRDDDFVVIEPRNPPPATRPDAKTNRKTP